VLLFVQVDGVHAAILDLGASWSRREASGVVARVKSLVKAVDAFLASYVRPESKVMNERLIARSTSQRGRIRSDLCRRYHGISMHSCWCRYAAVCPHAFCALVTFSIFCGPQMAFLASVRPLSPAFLTYQRFVRSVISRLPPNATESDARSAVAAAGAEFIELRVEVQVRP
jgi:hypothetical protein